MWLTSHKRTQPSAEQERKRDDGLPTEESVKAESDVMQPRCSVM
jgi:hypothetical protein